MTRKEGLELLEPFISKITVNSNMQNFVRYAFDNVADDFFEKPASSTGKYHPDFAQGSGGLLRHTIKAAEVFEDLWRAYKYKYEHISFFEEEKYSSGLAAVLLHDSCKYGKCFENEHTLKNHDNIGAMFIEDLYNKFFATLDVEPQYQDIIDAIACHHGVWSTTARPVSLLDELVFLSDYIASRKYVKLNKEI